MEADLQLFVSQLVNITNPEKVEEANKYVIELIEHDTAKALQMSVFVVMTDGVPAIAVKQSLNIIRTVFTPKYTVQLSVLKQKWFHFSDEIRTKIKQAIIRGLFFDDPGTRGLAAVDLMLIAKLDWSRAEEEVVIRALAGPFLDTDKYNNVCRIGSLQALRELVLAHFVTASSKIMEEHAPVFIGFLVPYIQSLGEDNVVDLVEMIKLLHALFPVLGAAFRDGDNRSQLIRLLAEKMSINNHHLFVVIYQLVFVIVKYFYDDSCEPGNQMMEHVFNMTQASLQSSNPEQIDPSLTFWMHLARFEKKVRSDKERVYLGLIEKVVQQLTPILFICIQSPSFDEPQLDDFNTIDISALGESCLKAFSELCPDYIATMIVENGPGMLRSGDWKQRSGGLIAFWCLVGVPNAEMAQRVFATNFSQFLALFADKSLVVCDNALCLIKDVLTTYPDIAYDVELMKQLLKAVSGISTANTAVTCRVMALLSSYAKVSVQNMERSTLRDYPDASIYSDVMRVLTARLAEAEKVEYQLITHVAGAMAEAIMATPEAPEATRSLVTRLKEFLERIQTLGASLATELAHDMVIRNMRTYCVVIYSIVVRLGKLIDMPGDSLPVSTMEILLKCLAIEDESLYEEALTTSVVLMQKSQNQLSKYLGPVMKHIMFALSRPSPVMVEASAVCLYGLLKQFGTEMAQYHKALFQSCMSLVENDRVPNRTRAPIIHAMSVIILETKPVDPAMLESFYAKLNVTAQLPFNIKSNPGDREIAAMFYDAMIHGYYAVMKKAAEAQLHEHIKAKYRIVSSLFERIADDAVIFTPDLVDHMVSYFQELMNLQFGRLLNVFLKKKCVRTILTIAVTEFHNEKAEFVQKRIDCL